MYNGFSNNEISSKEHRMGSKKTLGIGGLIHVVHDVLFTGELVVICGIAAI